LSLFIFQHYNFPPDSSAWLLKCIEFPSLYIIIISIIITKHLLFVVLSINHNYHNFYSNFFILANNSGFMIHVWSESDEIENVKKREKESNNEKGKISNRQYISHIQCYSHYGRCCSTK
ncbi:hypothetical protein T4B_13438, partial [Trichinella pseudospiralis]